MNFNSALETMNNQIKGYMRLKGYTYSQLNNLLKQKFDYCQSDKNLSRRVKEGRLSHIEFLFIMDILGLEFKVVEKAN